MMPIGPLMVEHRLIESMIAIMAGQLKRVENEEQIDPIFTYFILTIWVEQEMQGS